MSNSKEYNAQYWNDHKKEISEKRKKRYKEDEEHREHVAKKSKEWVENNRDKWNAYMRERRKKAKAIDENNTI